jgi:hypothetical protein
VKKLKILGLFIFLGLYKLQPAHATVEVYIGYLDQEATGVVNTLYFAERGKKVMVIAPGLQTKNILGLDYSFLTKPEVEKPHTDYSDDYYSYGGSKMDIYGNPLTKKPSPLPSVKTDERKLADNILNSLNGRSEYNYSVAGFPKDKNVKGDDNDVIVVIRPFANGRDPGALKDYLRTALAAVAKLPQAAADKGGIQISSFGTAGAVDPKFGPNDVISVKSSLFVGVYRNKDDDYVATIELASLGEKLPPIVLYSQKFWNQQDAEYAAKKAFTDWTDPVAEKADEICDSKQDDNVTLSYRPTIDKKWMTGVIANGVKKYIQGSSDTSLTTSFFADAATKSTAQKLGITNVNMEDFHVIALSNDLMQGNNSQVKGVSIDRVISDPAALPPEATNDLRDWLAKDKYSPDQYVDAIVWGLKKKELSNPPLSGKWTPFGDLPPSQTKKWVGSIPFSDGPAPLDPFFGNIAGSLLGRLNDDRFNLAVYLKQSLSEAVPYKLRDSLDDQLRAQTNEIKAMAHELAAMGYPKTKEQEGAEKAKASLLVQKLMYLDVTHGPLLDGLKDTKPFQKSSDGSIKIPLLATADGSGKMRVLCDGSTSPLSGDTTHSNYYDFGSYDSGGSYSYEGNSYGSACDISRYKDLSNESIYRMLYKITRDNLTQTNTWTHTLSEHNRIQKIGQTNSP